MSDKSHPPNEPSKPDQRNEKTSRPSRPEPVAAGPESSAAGGPVTKGPEQLIAELLTGELSAAETDRLAQLLTADPALRADYQKQAAIHATLHWCYGNVGQADLQGVDPIAIAELLAEVEQTVQRQAAEEAAEQAAREARAAEQRLRMQEIADRKAVRRPEPIVIPYSVAYLGAAALAASVLWIAFFLFPYSDPPTATPESGQTQLAATLTDSIDVELVALPAGAAAKRNRSISMVTGARLATGRYQLNRGIVALDFDGGASAVVEAPARIELISADRVRLTQGRLVGNVPREAVGFTVQTPTASIVDLGTEFGVEVSKDDSVDVLVFVGEVDVAAKTDKPAEDVTHRRLTANTSVQVKKGSFVSSVLRPVRFAKRVPSLREYRQRLSFQRWLAHSETLAADPELVAYYTFHDQNRDDPTLLNRAAATLGRLDGTLGDGPLQTVPTWTDGRWNQKGSLAFNRAANQTVVVPHDDALNIEDQITVATWVFPDPDYSNAVIAGKQSGESIAYQLAMHGPGTGKKTARRIQFDTRIDGRNAKMYSDKVLPAGGQWMHLAASCDGKTTRFFLNGTPVGEGTPEPGGPIGVTYDSPLGSVAKNEGGSFSFGLRFTVDSKVHITELGKFDLGGKGITEDQTVVLYNWDTGAKIVEATIPSGTPSEPTGTYPSHFVDIEDVALSPGIGYLLAVEVKTDDFVFDDEGRSTTAKFSEVINFEWFRATEAGSLAMPATGNAETYHVFSPKDTFYGPNFKFSEPDLGDETDRDTGPLTLSYSGSDQPEASTGFGGRIDELALFRRSLTGNEIRQMYEAGKQEK